MELNKIKDVVIPLTTEELSVNWFRGKAQLSKSYIETVRLHQGVCGVGCRAFDGLTNLKAITVDEGNPIFESDDGILYLKDKLMIKRYPFDKEDKEFVLPEETMYIEYKAFDYCKNLERVFLNQNIQEIPRAAFAQCENLRELHIPSSVTRIGNFAFNGCKNLVIYCPKESYARNYAVENKIPYWIEKELKTEIRPKTDASVRSNSISNSIREGLEVFKDGPRAMPPFARIQTEPMTLIGKFENGVYYKSTSQDKPFICSAIEVYRTIRNAVESNIPVRCSKSEWQSLIRDCKESKPRRVEHEQER